MNEAIAKLLVEKEIKPSYQRMKVMEYLDGNRDHPTVEQIYSTLKPEIPTLSKATVYNTLKLLEEKHLIKALTIEDNEVRYDAVVRQHGHFKCTECGTIVDFPVDVPELDKPELKGCSVEQMDVFLKGTCASCAKKSG